MEIKLQKNSVVYIPSYWFYSIQFGENAVILNCGYSTLMSAVATIPQRCLYLLQQQNITRRIAKSIPNIDAVAVTKVTSPKSVTLNLLVRIGVRRTGPRPWPIAPKR